MAGPVTPVGYLWSTKEGLTGTKEGLTGTRGTFYDYIVAESGVYIEARGPLLAARVRVAEAEIRGLAPLEELIELLHGKVPGHLYDLALSVLEADPARERYLAITWDGEYHLVVPEQDRGGASVEYQRVPHTLVDIHGHSGMRAFFSGADDADEQGLRLSMVFGKLDTPAPEVALRVCCYGYFAPLERDEVFE